MNKYDIQTQRIASGGKGVRNDEVRGIMNLRQYLLPEQF
jgi:hypothetical protein